MGRKDLNWKHGLWSLSPLLFFALFYVGSSLLAGDFYATPIIITFLLTLIYALLTLQGRSIKEKIDIVSEGASEKNILLMIWIFVLAGAFAAGAKYIGSIDATVNLALSVLPGNFLLAGTFIASCFLSLSMGTSVGTIAALTPIAAGLTPHLGIPLPMMIGLVVGGAFFGDNLSFISDTTIMATRTQGCLMKDKFKMNLRIIWPAALICVCLYYLIGKDVEVDAVMPVSRSSDILLVLPYLVVLSTAIAGIDVLVVLFLGIVSTAIVGLVSGSLEFHGWMAAMSNGVLGLGELIIVTLMAGGLMAVLRQNGGIDYIVHRMFAGVKSRKKGEFSIAGLVFVANLCTANNTISILTVGSIAKEIAHKCGIDPRKSASLLDTFSCLSQSMIPYGAQLLIASNLACVGTIDVIPFLFYPFLMGVFAVVAIMAGYPKMKSVR